MAVMLVRHGETPLNAARVMQPADTPLSARGQTQAALLAERLAGGRVAAILSSDLPRARLTAEAVAQRVALPIDTSALLQERNFGALRGRPYDTLGFDPLVMTDAPEGGESAAAFEQRAMSAFALMLQRHAGLDGDLVVVTHGLLIRTLLADPLRLPAQIMAGLHLGNTSVSIFDAEPPHALRLLNCTRHLDGATGDDARALSGG
jgi:broad specificity phosphatase PhoE